MTPVWTGLLLGLLVTAALVLYFSPQNIVNRARKRGVYLPPQSFERKVTFL